MEETYKELDLPLKYFELSPGIETAEFCAETMNVGDTKLASTGCPDVYTDIVYRNNLPGICEIHGSGSGRLRKDDKHGDSGW